MHLFHYTDLWNDLGGEIRRVAAALDIAVDDERLGEWVDALTLDSMRSRAADTAPEAHLDLWKQPAQFFASGGTRDWASLLTEREVARFRNRLEHLAGDATPWILEGRSALD